MIIIKTYGLDPYLLRDVSKRLTNALSNLFEVKEDEIDFIGMEGLLVHNGTEQNTWNIFLEVVLPKKLEVLEDDAYTVIEHYFKEVAINVKCIFNYYSMDNYHLSLSNKYPRFLTEDRNTEDSDINYKEVEIDADYEDIDSVDDIYLGNAFEDFEKKIK